MKALKIGQRVNVTSMLTGFEIKNGLIEDIYLEEDIYLTRVWVRTDDESYPGFIYHEGQRAVRGGIFYVSAYKIVPVDSSVNECVIGDKVIKYDASENLFVRILEKNY